MNEGCGCKWVGVKGYRYQVRKEKDNVLEDVSDMMDGHHRRVLGEVVMGGNVLEDVNGRKGRRHRRVPRGWKEDSELEGVSGRMERHHHHGHKQKDSEMGSDGA